MLRKVVGKEVKIVYMDTFVQISYKLTVLFPNLYQYDKVFQCDMSTFIYTNILTNTIPNNWIVI